MALVAVAFVQWEAAARAVVSLFVALAPRLPLRHTWNVYEFFADATSTKGSAGRDSPTLVYSLAFFDIAFEAPLGMKLHGDSLTALGV